MIVVFRESQLEDVGKTVWHFHLLLQPSLPCTLSCRQQLVSPGGETLVPDYKGKKTMLLCKVLAGVNSNPKAREKSMPQLKGIESGQIHSYLEESYSFVQIRLQLHIKEEGLLYFLCDLNGNLIQSPPHSNTQKNA